MTQQQNVGKGYWIGSAACCFLLAALMALTLIAWRPQLSAVLTTAVFIVVFLTIAILYLVRWRPVLRVVVFVIAAFYLLVIAYWLRTGQIIGPLPLAISVLLIWQTGRLQKSYRGV
jgi:cell division protein FtsW (lipid II flippase)